MKVLRRPLITALESLKQKLSLLHESKARKLEATLKDLENPCEERSTSITIGSKMMCPNCRVIRPVTEIKEELLVDATSARGWGREKAKRVPGTVITLSCGHERGEILPRNGISFEDVPSPEAERLFPVDWREVYKARLFRPDGTVRSWFWY